MHDSKVVLTKIKLLNDITIYDWFIMYFHLVNMLRTSSIKVLYYFKKFYKYFHLYIFCHLDSSKLILREAK